MTRRSGYLLAAVSAVGATLVGFVLGLTAAYVGLANVLTASGVVATIVAVAVLLWAKRPDHPVSRWLLLFAWSIAMLDGVGRISLAVYPRWLALLGPVMVTLGVMSAATIVALILLLPDGRYARRWHRRLTQGMLALVPLTFVVTLLTPSQLTVAPPMAPQLDTAPANPFHVDALAPLAPTATAIEVVTSVAFLFAVGALLLRYRRGRVEVRLQLRVIAAAAAAGALIHIALAVALPADAPPVTRSIIEGLAAAVTVLMLLGGIVLAVLRYRLLDIQIVLRRSVVYGVVWTATGLAYLGLATLLGLAATARLPVLIAVGLTVAATVALRPLRDRMNAATTTRLLGQKPTSYELLTQFGEVIEHAFDVDELAPELAEAVKVGIDAEWVRIKLNASSTADPVLVPAAASGAGLDDDAVAELEIPLTHGGETVGAIECGPRRSGRFGMGELELLSTLARQAALALRNARLAAELSARLDEIERQAEEIDRSRARLVAAQDAERRRIERDIHDGVQQGIAALIAKLRLARNQLRRDPALADATLTELQLDAGRTLEELREFAQGIHPPILTDRGLLEAVEGCVARLPIGVRIAAGAGLRGVRFDDEVETAAYFFVAEALTNVVKHAHASLAVVRLEEGAGALQVTVEDDGVGFVPADGNGSGLTGLRDRVEAVGGTMRIVTSPRSGTRVSALLPVRKQSTRV